MCVFFHPPPICYVAEVVIVHKNILSNLSIAQDMRAKASKLPSILLTYLLDMPAKARILLCIDSL
jgi:hypothetical protein